MLLVQVINALEEQRKSLGANLSEYSEIISVAKGPNAGEAIPMYALYRVNLEAPGRMTEEQFFNAFGKALEVLGMS